MASRDDHSMSVRYQSYGSLLKRTKTISGGGSLLRLLSRTHASICLSVVKSRYAPCILRMLERDIPMRMECYILLLDVGSLAATVGMA